MINQYVIIAYYIMWGILVFTSVSFLISGLDDLFFDIIYWAYMAWRKWSFRGTNELVYDRIAVLPQKRIAVMIACWHEAGVIEFMLRHNVYAIDYDKYDLFVGVYPNDPNTVGAVLEVEQHLPHVKCVIGDDPGPTNKASNLNNIFRFIKDYERQHKIQYDIFIIHDSEDIIHPLSFKVYNYLIPRNAMVQIPIFPLEISLSDFTHWTYAAEFSEAHTKDMVVREQINGLVPSAGVGTAFSREAMMELCKTRGGIPFAINTLTEDYSTALQIKLLGMREIFVTQFVYRTIWRKKWLLFGAYEPHIVKDYIATRAMFPREYMKAVRQKSRWVLGIAFEEWINSGWRGNFSTLYTLVHDRKTLFTHLITGLFFLLIPFWFLYSFFTAGNPDYPTLQDQFDQYPWVWNVIIISSYLMGVRIIERMIAVYRIYGLIPAFVSAPLIIYGNVINLHSLLRAYRQFIFSPKTQAGNSKWDKTDHEFPGKKLLTSSKAKFGDMCVERNFLTAQQLDDALMIQNNTGEQLGNLLVRLGYLSSSDLQKLLSEQYSLPIVDKSALAPLPIEAIPNISPFNYDRMLHSDSIPLARNGNQLTIAIKDPSNEVLLASLISWLHPYHLQFVLQGE